MRITEHELKVLVAFKNLKESNLNTKAKKKIKKQLKFYLKYGKNHKIKLPAHFFDLMYTDDFLTLNDLL